MLRVAVLGTAAAGAVALALKAWRRPSRGAARPVATLILTGTGTSSGVPNVRCLTAHLAESPGAPCAVCLDAAREGSRNRRRNTGCVIKVAGSGVNVAIDVGKFWYESAIRLFARNGVRRLDAVLLTHDHADACFGLDDLRDWAVLREDALPVHCAEETLRRVSSMFPYLVDSRHATGSGFVPRLDFVPFARGGNGGVEPFQAAGVWFEPVAMEHGPNYTCYGFLFGAGLGGGAVAWLSDVSALPAAAMERLRQGGRPLQLLVLDTLRRTPHISHFGLEQALDVVRALRPRRTLLVGMGHDLEHGATNRELRERMGRGEGLDVQLAYDGQAVDIYAAAAGAPAHDSS